MKNLNAIELTQELVRFDSCNPPGNELKVAEYLKNLLSQYGFKLRTHDYKEKRPNLIASYEWGPGPRLAMTGHLDTVPFGQVAWEYDPLSAELVGVGDEARIVGRGSSDMKAGLAAMIVSTCELIKEGGLHGGVDIIFCAAEETGCLGSEAMAKDGFIGPADALLVAEPTGNQLCLGHKGAMWLKAKAMGKAAHGSMPEAGDNAIYKAVRAIHALLDYKFQVEPHPMLGMPTFSVGTLNGGTKVNMVPDLAEFSIDVRTIPSQTREAAKAELAAVLGQDIELSGEETGAGSIWVEPDDPFVVLVSEVMQSILGEKPSYGGLPYFTDGANLAPPMGDPPVVILGPGEARQAHQTNEFCYAHRIGQAVQAYKEIMRRFLA